MFEKIKNPPKNQRIMLSNVQAYKMLIFFVCLFINSNFLKLSVLRQRILEFHSRLNVL